MINYTTEATDIILYLNSLTMIFSRYVGLSFYGFGLVSGLLNIYVFSQSALRSNPCCLFLLALNIVDLLHIHNTLLIRVLRVGFRWNPMVIFPFVCQLRYYIAYVLITLYTILLTFASCERYASTHKRHSPWRQFSKPITVCYTILSCTILCCLVCLFVPFCYSVSKASACVVHNSICTTLTVVYIFIVGGFVPPVFTAIFAWLTVCKLRIIRYRSRTGPISYKTYLRIKDANQELTSMLFMDIVAMLISSVPYASLKIYQLNTRYINKTLVRIAWEQLISESVHLLIYVNYLCSAYIYLATSPMYRKRLVLRKKLPHVRIRIVNEFINNIFKFRSRTKNEKTVLSIPINSSKIIKQNQQRRLTIISSYMTPHSKNCSTAITL